VGVGRCDADSVPDRTLTVRACAYSG
jgi:hypothetical protein